MENLLNSKIDNYINYQISQKSHFNQAEIERFLWYDSNNNDALLSNTLNNEVIPYCKERKLIR